MWCVASVQLTAPGDLILGLQSCGAIILNQPVRLCRPLRRVHWRFESLVPEGFVTLPQDVTLATWFHPGAVVSLNLGFVTIFRGL